MTISEILSLSSSSPNSSSFNGGWRDGHAVARRWISRVWCCPASATSRPSQRCVSRLQQVLWSPAHRHAQRSRPLGFRFRQHHDAPRRQFGRRCALRASSCPLHSRIGQRCPQPSSSACRSPQHGARIELPRAGSRRRVNAVASATKRLGSTLKCNIG